MITPKQISLILSGIFILIIVLSFIRGLIRGRHKSIYRLVVTTVFFIVAWLLLPFITSKLLSFDFSSIYQLNIDGQNINTIVEGIEFLTIKALGITKESNVVVADTMFYGFAFATAELLLRTVLLIILFVLNYTVIRWILWIVYLIIKPKKLKVKGSKHRLAGGIIAAVNAFAICMMLFVPLSGVFDMASNVTNILKSEETEVKVALSDEVINGGSNLDFDLINGYANAYRESAFGLIFGIKINGTEIDCQLFDAMYNIKYNGEKIKLRKEIDTVTSAVGNVKEVIAAFTDGKSTEECLDLLTKDSVVATFDKLSELNLFKVVIPVAFESGLLIVENNEEISKKYADVVDLVKQINPEEIDLAGTFSDVGGVLGSFIDLVESSGMKLSELTTKDANNILKAIINAEPEKVSAVFDSIGSIRIIDTLQDIAFTALESLEENSEMLNTLLVMYPKLESIDHIVYLNGIATEIEESDSYVINLTENKTWEVNGVDTQIDAKDSIYKLNYKDIKITDEIKNLGLLYEAFRKLDITDVSQIQEFIENGPESELSINLDLFTYENIDNLIKCIFDFKIIANNIENVYVIINNMLPNEFRGIISNEEFASKDITNIIYACKIVAQTNILWDENIISEDIDGNRTINYELLGAKFSTIKKDLAKHIADSSFVVENIDSVANYALSILFPTLKLDLSTIDWENNGESELLKLFNVVDELLKYGNKLTGGLENLSAEDIAEISDILKNNMAVSEILKVNMNNIFTSLVGLEVVKNSGIELVTIADEEWTKEELVSIFDTFKIVAQTMNESNDGSNLFINILNAASDNSDLFLSSKFITKNVIHNLVVMTSPGGLLENKICVNIPEDSEIWYDHYEGATLVDGELRKLFNSAFMLLENVTSLDDANLFISTVIENLNRYNNQDDIDVILDSKILSDTLVYYVENLDQVLGDEVSNLIVVSDDINYYGSDGELKKLISAACVLLIDEEEHCDLSKLTSGNTNDLLHMLLTIKDEDIDTLLESSIILDTIAKVLEEFGQEESTLTIFVPQKDRTRDEWRDEIKALINSSKIVLLDENNNLIDLNGNEESYIDILSKIDDKEIDVINSSEIIVCTLANLITKLSNENNSLITIGEDYKLTKDNYSNVKVQRWQDELKHFVPAVKELLFDNNNHSRYNEIVNADVNTLLSIISSVDMEIVTLSNIITDIVSAQILNVEGLIEISDKVKSYDRASWKEEIKSIVFSTIILKDESGNINLDSLSKSVNTILNNLCNLNNNFGGLNDEVGKVLKSEIISDTLIKYIKQNDKQNGGFLVVDVDNWKDGKTTEGELRKLIKAIKEIFGEEGIDVNQINVDSILEKENESINVILASKIINDTTSELVWDVVDGSELELYIKYKNVDKDLQIKEISDDLMNLITIFKKLNTLGISYQNFDYKALSDYINGKTNEKESRADELSDTFALSSLFRNSAPQMIVTILEGTLNSDQIKCVNTDLPEEEWFKASPEVGEFKKLFRLIAHLAQFTGDNKDSNSDITDSEILSKPLLLINDSKVLRGLIPTFVNDALKYVSEWKYDPENNLTKEMWDEEIIIICNIISLVNNGSFENLASLDIHDSNLNLDETLRPLLIEISKSRLIDISHIEGVIKTAVDQTFGTNVEIGKVYNGTDYNERVKAWNKEIDRLIRACKKLREITSIDLTSKETVGSPIVYNSQTLSTVGQVNAYYIGQFLDACTSSTILDPVVDEIFSDFSGDIIKPGDVISMYENYTNAMIALQKVLAMFG